MARVTKTPEERRLEIIQTAERLFGEVGFAKCSVEMIIREIGVAKGTFYYYFKSKEEALGEVCLFGIEDYVQRMESIAATDQPFEAKLIATVTSHLSSYRERNEALKVHNDERLYLPEEKRSKLKKLGFNALPLPFLQRIID